MSMSTLALFHALWPTQLCLMIYLESQKFLSIMLSIALLAINLSRVVAVAVARILHTRENKFFTTVHPWTSIVLQPLQTIFRLITDLL